MNHEPAVVRKTYGNGTQRVFMFSNGYGASVVQSDFSFGGDEGLWELGVLAVDSPSNWSLTYDTTITNDVIGHLTESDVQHLLDRIAALPERVPA